MWTGVICPPWTLALLPHSPGKSLPERGSPLRGWLPVKVWPLCCLRESQWNKDLGLPMGASVHNIEMQFVCLCLTLPFRPLLQRLSLVRISAPSPCSSLWVTLAWSEKRRSGYSQMCVFTSVCTASGMLCVSLQTHKVNAHVALQPTLPLSCLSTGICYLAFSFLSLALLTLRKACQGLYLGVKSYSRYPCQRDQGKGPLGAACLVWVTLGSSFGPIDLL